MKFIHTSALILGLMSVSACSGPAEPPVISSNPTAPSVTLTTACDSYLGQRITPVSIDTVIATLSRLPSQRGEFETTSQFDARVADALDNVAGSYIVRATFNAKHATYDADGQRFRVESFAIGHGQPYWHTVFGYGHPLHGQVEYDSYENIGISVSDSETVIGTYRASNAFGVATRVTEIRRNDKAIFERKAAFGEDLYSPPGSDTYRTKIIAEIPADPAIAPNLKNTMKAALVIAPKSPWVAAGRGHLAPPTIDNPQSVEQVVSAVIADIQCALITDGKNKVIAAVTTR